MIKNHLKFTFELLLISMIATVATSGFSVMANDNEKIDWRYIVKPNDTVSILQERYLKPSINWKKVSEYNKLKNPNVIYPGQRIQIPLQWLAIIQASAKLTMISGHVEVQSSQGSWHAAQTNESLQTGQSIRVGPSSSARIQFADGSDLVVQPETTLHMDSLSTYAGGYMADSRLRLQKGRVEVQANPDRHPGQKFEVQTPAAIASVRGTQFLVDAQESLTIEQTSEGHVELRTPTDKASIPQGYVSAARAGEATLTVQASKPAPELEQPVEKFTDFPIAFSLKKQEDAASWVMQVGLDPQMAQLVRNLSSQTNTFDMAALADGDYYLRTWSKDRGELPSKMTLHPFKVSIPRESVTSAFEVLPDYFKYGPMGLTLQSLPAGKRYLIELTSDKLGRQPVWYMANVKESIKIPLPADTTSPYYLWVWTY